MTILYVRESDHFKEAPAQEILLTAQELVERKFRSRFLVLNDPDSTRLFLQVLLGNLECEVFAGLFLDTHLRLIAYVELFRGTVDASLVHPREVVKEALTHNAAAVIFAHNHPSGVTEPSEADERIHRILERALDLIGVRIVDHLIVGECVSSLVKKGMSLNPVRRQ